jgi:hypothetical protein
MLDSTDNNVDFVRKTVLTNVQSKRIFSGWQFEVENTHVFLTKTTSTNNQSYVSIEHNPPLGCIWCTGASTSPECPKAAPKCSAYGECVDYDTYCP